VDIQSDIIGRRSTRIVIPLLPADKYQGPRAERLTPFIPVEGNEYVLMTHELASIPEKALGDKVCLIIEQRSTIKAAINFLFDGI